MNSVLPIAIAEIDRHPFAIDTVVRLRAEAITLPVLKNYFDEMLNGISIADAQFNVFDEASPVILKPMPCWQCCQSATQKLSEN